MLTCSNDWPWRHLTAIRPPNEAWKGYCHAFSFCDRVHCPAGYLHRDLKPANLLLTEEGVLKVGDLGLARPHDAQAGRAAAYTHTVATRWYRAPELLLGSRSYGPPADMWAVGCILAEMLGAHPQGSAEFTCLRTCSPFHIIRGLWLSCRLWAQR